MTAVAHLDLAFVRAAFPALAHGEALFDNAGGTVPPRQVIDALAAYLATHAVQLGATYGASARAAEAVHAGRVATAALIGAAPEELVFAPSTTRNAQLFARAFAPRLAPGDEVVVTNLDHEANRGPWARLAEHGATVREWALRPDTARLHVEDLAPLLGERTRLVAVPRASNLVGTVVDLRAVEELVRRTGALLVVDEVASAPHSVAWGPTGGGDVCFASLYKTLGPHLAVAWARSDTLRSLANQNHDFYSEDQVPGKLEPGGVPHEAVASMVGVLAYWLAFDEHHEGPSDLDATARVRRATERAVRHERALAQRLVEFVVARRDLRLFGPPSADPSDRVPIVAFHAPGRSSRALVTALDAHRLGVRHGHFYAPRAARALGLDPEDGVVRVSFAHYDSPEELDRLLDALEEVL